MYDNDIYFSIDKIIVKVITKMNESSLYCLETTYNVVSVTHTGVCNNPKNVVRTSYVMKLRSKLPVDILDFCDSYGNVDIEKCMKYVQKEPQLCKLGNIKCPAKIVYTPINVDIVKNPMYDLKTKLCEEGGFQTLREMENAYKNQCYDANTYHKSLDAKVQKKQEIKKAKTLASKTLDKQSIMSNEEIRKRLLRKIKK